MFDSPHSPRQRFVDDELMRIPMVADQVLNATWPALQQALPALSPQARAVAADLLSARQRLHPRFVERFAETARRQVRAREATPAAGESGGAPPASGAPAAPALALMDDSAVTADVEISRVLQTVRSVAEHELRELTAYASALAGDKDVTRDRNPLQPEVFARALWDAAQALPVSDAHQVMLMRHAGAPMAQVLRKVFAGACARLEAAGLTPAAYRTLVPQPGGRGWRPDDSLGGAPHDLHRLREVLPAGPPAGTREAATRPPPAGETATTGLFAQLFEAMLADRRISRDIRGVLAQVRPVAQRVLVEDPSTLDRDDHPLWRFVDEMVFQASLFAKGSTARDEQLGLSESLVASLARAGTPDTDALERARARLDDDTQRRFQSRTAAVAEDIDVLQALEADEATSQEGMPTGFGPLDASQLDTVPANLMADLSEGGPATKAPSGWMDVVQPGDWVQLFTQGQWLQAQLLWRGRHGDVWLFGQGQTARTTALRLRAIERLAAEGLLRPLVRRSLLRSAAARLLREAGPPAS